MDNMNVDLDVLAGIEASITLKGKKVPIKEPSLRQMTKLSMYFMQMQSATDETVSVAAEQNMGDLLAQIIPELEGESLGTAAKLSIFNLLQNMVNPNQKAEVSDDTIKKVLGLAT